MTNIVTQQPIRVDRYVPEGTGHIRVPVEQLDEVRRVLDSHEIPYWVNTYALNDGAGHFIAHIGLSFRADQVKVQALLDAA